MIEMAKRNPTLVGGIIIGAMSLIPYLAWGDFLWALLGGALITRTLIAGSAIPFTLSKGAKVGIFAGLIAGLICLLVATPLRADWTLSSLAQANPQMSLMFENIQQKTLLKYFISFLFALFTALLLAVCTLLGGIIGVVLFEKRKADREAVVLVEEETQS